MKYSEIIEEAEKGSDIRIDFKKRTLLLNGKKQEIEVENAAKTDLDSWLDKLEDLYDAYKYSIPNTRTNNRRHKCLFKALNETELIKQLGKRALASSQNRSVAQAALEAFILTTLISGQWNPEELFSKDWYFQGSDKDLVLVKDWFLQKN